MSSLVAVYSCVPCEDISGSLVVSLFGRFDASYWCPLIPFLKAIKLIFFYAPRISENFKCRFLA